MAIPRRPQTAPAIVEREILTINGSTYRLQKVRVSRSVFHWRVYRLEGQFWVLLTKIPLARKAEATEFVNDLEAVEAS